MTRKKTVLALLLACLAGCSHAPKKRERAEHEIKDTLITYTFPGYERQVEEKWELIPPALKDTVITYTFTAPELRVNQAFIDSLNAILFGGEKDATYYQPGRDFHLVFEQMGSVNYRIWVILDKEPGAAAAGFFDHNGYRYWFSRDTPPGIILETGAEKRFSYKEYKYQGFRPIYDPILWFVKYNRQTGELEDNRYPFGYLNPNF